MSRQQKRLEERKASKLLKTIQKMNSLLYPHQSEPMEDIMNSDRGKIIYPTGTGKTYMQAATISLDILHNPHRVE